jgi:hypothetical protein
MKSTHVRIIRDGRVIAEQAHMTAYAIENPGPCLAAWGGSFIPEPPVPEDELFAGGIEIEIEGVRHAVEIRDVRYGILVQFRGTGSPPSAII